MEINNSHNQGYWFVLREDQSNVIFSSNNFAVQNTEIPGQETRYIVNTGDRQYIQINEAPVPVQEITSELCEKEPLRKSKEEDNFWDRNKIKLLLTMCLENRFRGRENAVKEKALWNKVAAVIGSAPEECSKKYKNLRRTYIRLLKKKRLGKDIKWVHYNTCEEVFKDCKTLHPSILEPWEDSKVRKLLSLYIENLNRFRTKECLQKDIWKDIATQLGTTEYNCYHKFKNLKRTYFNWAEKNRESGKLIKWPYCQYFERIFYNYKPTLGPWDRTKVKLLLDAYVRRAYKFSNPKYQKKELWAEISKEVRESPNDCDRKFRNLKQTYIRIKMKTDSDRLGSKWRYYKDFEAIYNRPLGYLTGSDGVPRPIYKNQDDYIKQLLTFYLENKEKFRNPLIKNKTLWKLIAPTVGLSSQECDRKFRNLKQTYVRLAERKRETGNSNKWPYYQYFEKIYGDHFHDRSDLRNIDDVSLSEIRKMVQEVNERKDCDKFEKLIHVVKESNSIQRERNKILQALLDRK